MEGEVEKNDGTKGSASTDSLPHWSQWQLIDSIFPTGGFAHSFGLEAATQARLISGPEDLQTRGPCIGEYRKPTSSFCLLCNYLSPNIQTWYKLDKMLNVTLTNEGINSTRISSNESSCICFYRSPFSQNNDRCIFRHWDGLFPLLPSLG